MKSKNNIGKKLGILVVFLGLFVGCESKVDEQKAKEAIAFKDEELKKMEYARELKKEQQETHVVIMKENNETNITLLRQMGIESGEGKLIIDTHKTKEFFTQISDDVKAVAKDIKKDIQESNFTFSKAIGIEQNGTILNVDLNKTKGFFDDMGKRIDRFVKEINSTN